MKQCFKICVNFLFVWITLLFFAVKIHAQHVRVPRINIEDFSATEEDVTSKIAILEGLITEAENNGIDALKEKMTISLANVFLFYADWDENHKDQNEFMYSDLAKFHQTTSQNIANNLPDYLRSELLDILNESINTLNALMAGEITRKPIPNIDWSQITYGNGQQLFNGEPVFLSDFTWQPETAGASNSTAEFFGDYDGYYLDPKHVINENGDIPNWMRNHLTSKPDGNFGIMFFGQNRYPDWLRVKYPEIEVGGTHFIKYDIGSPGAKEVFEKLCAAALPLMKGKNYTKQGYMLANEPHWNLSGSWAVNQFSEHTKDSLRTWLQNKHGDINTLNTLWQKSYTSFDEVDVGTFPMSNSEQGKPIWYDVMRFNQERVTNWFQFLHDEVRKYDPNGNTHIKLIPKMWSQNQRYNGLDFEALTNITAHIGNDAGSRNSYRWGGPFAWEDRYAYLWRDMGMTFDFFRSVSPNKINYNSEAHYVQAVGFGDLFLDRSYVRATYWQSVIQGMNSAQSWVWPRLENGDYRDPSDKGLAATVVHQPKVVNEITSTFMDLNSHSRDIANIQRLRQSIRIFHSETSAINKGTHMDQTFELYESLYFEGTPIGFATKNIIETQNHTNWDVILVNRTEYVTQEELTALQTYLDNGGSIILDAVSLKMDEYGVNHTQSLNTNNGGTIITGGSVADFTTKALNFVESKGRLPNVTVQETNSLGLKGCFWRSYKNSEDKEIFNVINVGKTEATINIGLKGASSNLVCINVLTGEKLEPTMILAPEAVYLLEIREKTAEDNRFTIRTTGETCPDQDNGRIYIEADIDLNYTATVNNVDTVFTKTLTIEDLAPGNYQLCITTEGLSEPNCFNIEIKEASEITAKTDTKDFSKVTVNIEEGTPPYSVRVNNVVVFETMNSAFEINVEQGDEIQVKSSVECEGLMTKTVDFYENLKAYPNPTSGMFQIVLPNDLKIVPIEIYGIQGQNIISKTYPVELGTVNVNLNEIPSGIYFAKIMLKKPVNIKIIKK